MFYRRECCCDGHNFIVLVVGAQRQLGDSGPAATSAGAAAAALVAGRDHQALAPALALVLLL